MVASVRSIPGVVHWSPRPFTFRDADLKAQSAFAFRGDEFHYLHVPIPVRDRCPAAGLTLAHEA